MNINIKFRKALLDGVLVFIGIFLALILENYFADIELRDKQNRLLGELIGDLDETISDIANDIQSYNEFMDSTKNVINILNQGYSDLKSSRTSHEITLATSAAICG